MSAARIDVKVRLQTCIESLAPYLPHSPAKVNPVISDLRLAIARIDFLEKQLVSVMTPRDHYRIAAMQSLMLRYENLDPNVELVRQVDELVDVMLGVENDL